MTDRKISELGTIPNISPDSDIVPIVDVDASQTKSTTVKELVTSVVPLNEDLAGQNVVYMQSYGIADGDDITTHVQSAADHIGTIGGGTIMFPAGEFIVGEIDLPLDVNVMVSGALDGRYSIPSKSLTVLRRKIGATYMFNAVGSGDLGGVSHFHNIALIGEDENGLNGVDDPLQPSAIKWQNTKRGTIYYSFIDGWWKGVDGGDSDPMGGVDLFKSVFRASQFNIYKMVDSRVYDCHITGARKFGVLVDSGQNRIERCFFEFDRGTDSNGLLAKMATSISIQQNSSEVVVSNNVFDRCSGPLIELRDALVSGVHKRPKYVMISNNHFKRNGWGSETFEGGVPTDSDRATIVCRGYLGACDNLLIHGNQWQASDSEPSEAAGIFSPMILADLGMANVSWKDNDTSGAPPYIDIVFGKNLHRRYEWEQVGATNEWMLIDTDGSGKNPLLIDRDPEIEAPDWVYQSLDLGDTLTAMTSGTAGSLAAGEYAYAASGEGFDTLFVRMSDDSDPNGLTDLVRIGYNKAQILDSGAVVRDDTYLTRIPKWSIAGGGSKTFTIRTHRHLSTTRQNEFLTLDLFGQQSGTAAQGGAQIILQSFRGTSPVGTIQVRQNTNLGSLTVTGSGGGGNLEFAISNIHPNNEQFDLTISNTTGNGINIEGGIR